MGHVLISSVSVHVLVKVQYGECMPPKGNPLAHHGRAEAHATPYAISRTLVGTNLIVIDAMGMDEGVPPVRSVWFVTQ